LLAIFSLGGGEIIILFPIMLLMSVLPFVALLAGVFFVVRAALDRPPSLTMVFHLGVNGQARGPFAEPILKQMAAAGTLTAASLVWRRGMPNWQAAATVPELAALFPSRSSAPPPLA
jgi:hypothetical protein